MIANAEERIRTDTVTLCLDINAKLAMRLKNHSRVERCSQDDMVNSILEEYFHEMDKPTGKMSGKEFRRHVRKEVQIPGVMEIKLANNETQYKPVSIVNISVGGIGITMEGKTTRVLETINKQIPFLIIFSVPSIAEIIHVLCKPIHITMNAATEIGAAYLKIPDEIRTTLRTQFQL